MLKHCLPKPGKPILLTNKKKFDIHKKEKKLKPKNSSFRTNQTSRVLHIKLHSLRK